MKQFTRARLRFAAAVAAITLGSTALADFSGQTILGPLSNGSSVNGNNTGASDDNDGWFSGAHIFDIWTGGDDVWRLNWGGGDLTVTLSYDNFFGDPDLFLYRPSDLDESALDSILNTGIDEVNLAGAPAGTYFVLIDTTSGNEGPYSLAITPEPGSLALLGLGALALLRRR